MAGMVPATPAPQSGATHVVFVPVPGAVVFFVCVFGICVCFVWLLRLLHQGVEADR